MTAKEYLSQIRKLNTLINQRIRQKSDLWLTIDASGIDYSRERVQTSPEPDAPYVRTLAKIDELEREIDTLIDEYVDKKNEIIGRIQALEDENHVRLLYLRYVEGKSLAEVAEEMHYSYEWIRQLHSRALKALTPILTDIPNPAGSRYVLTKCPCDIDL